MKILFLTQKLQRKIKVYFAMKLIKFYQSKIILFIDETNLIIYLKIIILYKEKILLNSFS